MKEETFPMTGGETNTEKKEEVVLMADGKMDPERNEEAVPGMDEELRKDVEAVLNLFVRPHISTHGGDLEVTGLDEEGTLWIEMLGECAGCPSADETAKDLVEKEICARIPKIRKVEIDSGIDPELLQEAMKLLGRGKEKA